MYKYEILLKDETFLNWKKEHPKAFLLNLFHIMDSPDWQYGFYDPDSEKISPFAVNEKNDEVSPLPPDEVFKKPGSEVKELKKNDVKIEFNDAIEIAKKETDDFIKCISILHMGNELPQWNITFASRKLTTMNVKINATNGTLIEKKEVNLFEQMKAPSKQ